MPQFLLEGIQVDFPYDAYECQKEYMRRVIQALNNGSNALLESPTGTGKTLCILCACLAWRKHKLERRPVTEQQDDRYLIVYSSRTHSQLKQVVHELRKTSYGAKGAVLGSREQFCMHPKISTLRGAAQNNACRKACAGNRCSHYRAVKQVNGTHKEEIAGACMDIEELVQDAEQRNACQYFLQKDIAQNLADICFLPYNYLVDSQTRRSLSLPLENSIIIFDEAHNIEGVCGDAASHEIHSTQIASALRDLDTCIRAIQDHRVDVEDGERVIQEFVTLKALLLQIEEKLTKLCPSHSTGVTKPGPFIFELFGHINVTSETVPMFIGVIDKAITVLSDADSSHSDGSGTTLEGFAALVRQVFYHNGQVMPVSDATIYANYYRVHLYYAEKARGKQFGRDASPAVLTVGYWCFNPGVAMENIEDVRARSIIVTSGTLSPLSSFAAELKISFPIQLENDHVIAKEQVLAAVISRGPSGHALNSSYRTRSSPAYISDLGQTIVNVARVIPDGLLVFFPSYAVMDECMNRWKEIGMMSRIASQKRVFVEPRKASELRSVVDEFQHCIEQSEPPSGCVFFAVCRGKVSEGIDFADRAGRAVIVTGLPYPSTGDPKVKLKREFLDEEARKGGKLRGEEWYSQQAIRAVNQAIGRVIRHRNDYGAILLCDERFAYSSTKQALSKWVRPQTVVFSAFSEAYPRLASFFKVSSTKYDELATAKIDTPRSFNSAEALAGVSRSKRPHVEPTYDFAQRDVGAGYSAGGNGATRTTGKRRLVDALRDRQSQSGALRASTVTPIRRSPADVPAAVKDMLMSFTAANAEKKKPGTHEMRRSRVESGGATPPAKEGLRAEPRSIADVLMRKTPPAESMSIQASQQGRDEAIVAKSTPSMSQPERRDAARLMIERAKTVLDKPGHAKLRECLSEMRDRAKNEDIPGLDDVLLRLRSLFETTERAASLLQDLLMFVPRKYRGRAQILWGLNDE